MKTIIWIIIGMLFGAFIYYLLGAYLTWSFDYITHIGEWDLDKRKDYLAGFVMFCILGLVTTIHKSINL